MTSTPEEIVEHAISTHPVVVFSKTYCPYCKKAKAALKEAGAKVEGYPGAFVIELDIRDDGPAIQAYLASKTGRRSVPNVFIGGKTIGGGDETVALASSGVLPQMIAAAIHQGVGTDTKTKSKAGESAGNWALFGAGCFWGIELAFQREVGVLRTEVGYANGNKVDVGYNEVCTGRSGHAEVVKVWYDDEPGRLLQLLKLWEGRHDVTSLNKQGNDLGTQYRSAVFYNNDVQKDVIMKWKDEANTRHRGEIVTDIDTVKTYCPAEDSHQQYLQKRGQSAKKGATERIRCYG